MIHSQDHWRKACMFCMLQAVHCKFYFEDDQSTLILCHMHMSYGILKQLCASSDRKVLQRGKKSSFLLCGCFCCCCFHYEYSFWCCEQHTTECTCTDLNTPYNCPISMPSSVPLHLSVLANTFTTKKGPATRMWRLSCVLAFMANRALYKGLRYLHWIHTRYILSCLPLLTWRRRSMRFCTSSSPALWNMARSSSETVPKCGVFFWSSNTTVTWASAPLKPLHNGN